jgi:N-acyl-D-amino-acid deacylase
MSLVDIGECFLIRSLSVMRKIITLLILVFVSKPLFCATALWNDTHQNLIQADIAILNGTIIDGSGQNRYRADIAIFQDKIVYIGNEAKIEAPKVIESHGLVVSPGFIDSHSHVDYRIKKASHRLNESSLTQGITTIVFGADGEYSPNTLRTLLATFDEQGVGTNVGFYVGHNGIRESVMKNSKLNKPSTDELTAMVTLVKEGMKLGAVGFSTGLMYEPGRYSETEEVVALTKAVVPFGGIYDSHVRDPINQLVESDLEVISIARQAKVAAKIAHLKTVCLQNKNKSFEIIEMIKQARSEGLNIVSDQYPYDGAKTYYLESLITLTQQQLRQEIDIKTVLRDPNFRGLIQSQSENGIDGGFSWLQTVGYSCIRITQSEDYPELVGAYLSEIAKNRNIANFALLTDLIINAKKPVQVTLAGIQEQEVQQVLVQPWNMIVSDGRYIDGDSSFESHPRSTGTFPRILGHYVRELKLLTLEEAVKKMTSQPADFLGFTGRGRLQAGNYADITIFDPKRIKDRSTYSDPLQFSVGVKYVLVNGQVAINNGDVTGITGGSIIHREKATQPNIARY